ncbi:MAG TPA: valine--tRNA ligase [Patescibacteria group bacterium]|nr:valine--tRNA ligase [Patescibacteria group bacterium]
MNKELSKQYEPKKVEPEIYQYWEKGKFFEANIDTGKEPFCMMIPPPNVTGELHMGHALNNTIIDSLIRWQRMKGKNALYQPGTDHAGIATQNKVEQKLAKEGKTRLDLGRKNFEKEVWNWKNQYEKRILGQLKTLGCSCDWQRNRFTMDAEYTEAVMTAFKHYYDKGWIYQGTRVVNWCPRCATSISDIEVKHKPQKTLLYYFKYDLKFPITIATTRPETKLGDTGVAVHPKDKRYKKFIGKTFQIDFAGQKREIKVVADSSINRKFGTGAVGLTPAHSIIDEKIADKNHLEKIKIIDEKIRMTEAAGKDFVGLRPKAAREKVVAWLRDQKLISREVEIEHNLSLCDRCSTTVEPLPSLQWFLKMSQLAKPAIEAVKTGKIKFHPAFWKKVYLAWMENIEDWCISRQLWWGHRLPVWHKQEEIRNPKSEILNKSQFQNSKSLEIRNSDLDIYVGDNPPEGYEQVEDVLDTWFSSALWPFAALGWPQPSPVFQYYFPTQILSTARDIIFLWVARMIFSSLELTGEIPFRDVYIHPTIFNIEGRRMSKSLGTGVDPLELIKKYGADAVRFGLLAQNTGVQDLKFSEDTIAAGAKFANKIWNAVRFVRMNLEISDTKLQKMDKAPKAITDHDKKFLNNLNNIIKSTDNNLTNFRFGQTAQELYNFFWHTFCDQYLEYSKEQMKDEKLKKNTQKILYYTICQSLKLMHPIMPFITEEIWRELGQKTPLIISEWPKSQ